VDGFLRFLFAVVAALNAATGAPLNAAGMPDHPPIMVPTLAPLPIGLPAATMPAESAKTTAISGTITNIQDGFVFVSGIPVSLGPETQVNGLLRAGSFVLVQATVRADGGLEAEKLDVGEDSPAPREKLRPTEQPQAQTSDNPAVKPTATREIKPAPSLVPQPTDTPAVQPTEKPEVKPTDKPAVQPTEKPEVKPTDKPEVQPTGKPNGDGGSNNSNGSGQTGGTDSGKGGNPGTNSDSSKSGNDNGSGD
jgi:hypothetical protein